MSEPLQLPESIRLIRLNAIASTNDEAKQLATAGAEEGTLVWADEQTRGRGRQGRIWHSPPGNLYCSLVLRPAKPPGESAGLSFVASLSVCKALEEFLPSSADLRLKWPNDVLINGKKTAGILSESAATGAGNVEWVIIGCGVNVASHPAESDYPVTNLMEEGCSGATVDAVLVAYLRHTLDWVQTWREHGFAPVRDAWLDRAIGLGGPIRVRLGAQEIEGRFTDMDETGTLLVELADGKTRKVTAGDVFLAS